jgi:cytochrome P450
VQFLYQLLVAGKPHHFFNEVASNYNPAVFYRAPFNKYLYLTEPGFIEYVLKTKKHNYEKGSFNKFMKGNLSEGLFASPADIAVNQPTKLKGLFTEARISKFSNSIVDYADQYFAKLAHSKETFNFSKASSKLTQVVNGHVLLGVDLKYMAEDLANENENLHNHFNFKYFLQNRKADLPVSKRFKQARSKLDTLVDKLITLKSRDFSVRGTSHADLITTLIKDPTIKQAQAKDEIRIILLSAAETLKHVLDWSSYLLARNPDALAKLKQELTGFYQDKKTKYIDFDELNSLTYLNQVILEVLRLYPAIWSSGLKAKSPDEYKGIQIPTGTNLHICPFAMQRHANNWGEPERFIPERFEHAEIQESYSYTPFGVAVKDEPEFNFITYQAKLIIARLVKNLDFSLANRKDVNIKAQLMLKPSEDIVLNIL